MQQTHVLFSEEKTANGKKIGIAQLNSPKSLNALNLSMINLLIAQIEHWQRANDIALILLIGSGDKAFCAGGDVVSIYHDITDYRKGKLEGRLSDHEVENSLGVEFFTKEYQLDLLIHQSEKPIFAWADGYVMGGGIGLMAGASHKVVTDKTLMAMPEVTIGLYPDVGASWFLNQMPKGVGLFLGLTGMTFNGADAKFIKLADYQVNTTFKLPILKALMAVDWQESNDENHHLLSQVLYNFERSSVEQSPSNILEHLAVIERVTSAKDIADVYQAIVSENTSSTWFKKSQEKITHGSPLSLHLIYRQLKQCEQLSLHKCFKSELNLSLRCCQHTEFSEGVRALLVDKDKQPKWKYPDVKNVDKKEVDWFFSAIDSLN